MSLQKNLLNIYRKKQNELLIDTAFELVDEYKKNFNIGLRKKKGQIFTPKEISIFMANMLSLDKNRISIIDCGAGTGILTAAISQRILNEIEHPMNAIG